MAMLRAPEAVVHISVALVCIANLCGAPSVSATGSLPDDSLNPMDQLGGAPAPDLSTWLPSVRTPVQSRTSQGAPRKLPFSVDFVIQKNYLFFGLALLNDKPLQMVPDAAFSSIPVALSNLVLYRFSDGPCGAFDWVVYSTTFTYDSPSGPMYFQRSTQSWSTKAECCGSGTFLLHACEVANITWTTRPDGKEDVAIFEPSNLGSPVLTVTGLSHWSTTSGDNGGFGIWIPNTAAWAVCPGFILFCFMRWVSQDVASLRNGTQIVGHVLNNFVYDTFLTTFASYEKIGGLRAASLPDMPIGFYLPPSSGLRIEYTAF
eukprot:jgi/Botrbrau1/14640/Bobra.0108s0003.1